MSVRKAKKPRKKRHILAALLFVALTLLLCMSGRAHEIAERPEPLFGQRRVQLSSGRYPANTKSLTVKLSSQDIPMLAWFDELERADFSGSSCTDAIARWAEEHPNVLVKYSVALPDGTLVDNDATELDLTGFAHGDTDALLIVLRRIPTLQRIRLGAITRDESGFMMDDLAAMRELCPGAVFDFSLDLNGRSISPDATELDLSGLTREQVTDAAALLSCMNHVEQVKPDPSFTLDDVKQLAAVCPDAVFDYRFTLYGRELNLNCESLDYNHVRMDDNGAAMAEALPLMRRCRSLDMDSTGVTSEVCAKLREDNPNVDVVWRIWFGNLYYIRDDASDVLAAVGADVPIQGLYSVRTDTERIFASKSQVAGLLTDEDLEQLKYCTKVKYLDIGHNDNLTNLSFVRNMPDLEVLIFAMMVDLTDISPLADCPKLEYLELFSCPQLSDISPLASCHELRHLNICECPLLTDISPLYNIPLERLWLGCKHAVPADQIECFKSCQPYCQVNTETADPTEGAWRYYSYDIDNHVWQYTDRYKRLREQLGYDAQEYSFYWLDPKCGLEAPAEFKGIYYGKNEFA